MKQRRTGEPERVAFEPSDGSLTVRLRTLGKLVRGGRERIADGSTVPASVVAVDARLEVDGAVDGHLVAIGTDVVLRPGARVSGYLYLVDSRLDAGPRWDGAQRFHSMLLPRPWETIAIDAGDRTEAGSEGRPRSWRLERDQPPPPPASTASITIDTRAGSTTVEGDPSSSGRRFVVDGVDRSAWFTPFSGQPITFNGGSVLVFGGSGARFSSRREEWTIRSGNVVAVAGGGYAVLGARDGVRFQPRERLLVANGGLIRCHLPHDDSSYEGRELVFRLADATVEVRT